MTRETRLMQLAKKYVGDRGSLNTGLIDSFLYLFCEAGEAAFGPEVIDRVEGAIGTSTSYLPRGEIIQKAASLFFEKVVMQDLKLWAKQKEVIADVVKIGPLTEGSYIDYFTSMLSLNQALGRTSFGPNLKYMQQVLLGFQNQAATEVVQGIVGYLEANRDPIGFEEIVLSLVEYIRGKVGGGAP